MTPKQLKESTSTKLMQVLKNKGGCYHSKRQADAIFNELSKRHGSKFMQAVSTELWHVRHGEPAAMFYEECDKNISLLTQ